MNSPEAVAVGRARDRTVVWPYWPVVVVVAAAAVVVTAVASLSEGMRYHVSSFRWRSYCYCYYYCCCYLRFL